MDELTAGKIVDGLRAGDRGAWAALCDQFSAGVWQYVARLIGSDSEAVADVFQETMLAAARSGRNLAPESNLRAWLLRISHNQVALYWRKRFRAEAQEIDGGEIDHAADEPVDLLRREETNESVRRILAQMKADHVALLTAKYVDGLSIAQIVESIGGTTESVRSRLARARRDFRDRCARCFDVCEGGMIAETLRRAKELE